MTDGQHPHADLVAHLVRTTSMSPGEALRVVADVLAYFSESTEEYVRRRHRELQARGLRNEEIFTQLDAELQVRRVAPQPLTQRQLRRLVYG